MLRIAAEEDVSAMLAIYRPYVLTSTATFEYDPPSEEEFLRRYHDHHRPVPVASLGGRTGRFSAMPMQVCPLPGRHTPGAPNPPFISNLRHGAKGIGKALYDALEAILDAQGYYLLYSLVCGENENSMRFHEKRGYRTVAHFPACGFKFGRWLDLNWMEKRLKGVDPPGGVPSHGRPLCKTQNSFTNI